VHYLEDTSTNGTAINGLRVPKGQTRQLAEGDRIRLAVATQDPSKIIE
jgi:predicted component of type VI protein secretion system